MTLTINCMCTHKVVCAYYMCVLKHSVCQTCCAYGHCNGYFITRILVQVCWRFTKLRSKPKPITTALLGGFLFHQERFCCTMVYHKTVFWFQATVKNKFIIETIIPISLLVVYCIFRIRMHQGSL